jgi:hypothetical protein
MSKDQKEPETLGLKERAVLGIIEQGVSLATPKIVEALTEAIKSPDTKGLGYALQGLEYFGRAGIQFLEDVKTKQVSEEKARLEQEAKEKEIALKKERFNELKRFLTFTQDVIHKPQQPSEKKSIQPIENLKAEELTRQELLLRQQKAEQEQKDQELIKAIREKYLYKHDVVIEKQKSTITGANLRKWWIDKDFPTDEEGHPDLRWIEQVGKMQELSALLVGANLHSFNLACMNLENLKLFCTTLTGADLTRTNISGAQVINADMCGANFTDAICYIKIGDNEHTSQPVYLKLNGERLEAYLREQGTLIHKAVFSTGQPLIRIEGIPNPDYENPYIAPFLEPQIRVKFHVPPEQLAHLVNNAIEDYSPSTSKPIEPLPSVMVQPQATPLAQREDVPQTFVAALEKERSEKKEEKQKEEKPKDIIPSAQPSTPSTFVDKTKKPDIVDKFVGLFT